MVTLDPIGIPKLLKSDFESFCQSHNVIFNISYYNNYIYNKIYYSVAGDSNDIILITQYEKNINHLLLEHQAYDKSIQQYVFYYKHEKYVKLLIFAFIIIMTIILKG